MFYPNVGGKRVDALEFYAAHFKLRRNQLDLLPAGERGDGAELAREDVCGFHFYSESLAEIYYQPENIHRLAAKLKQLNGQTAKAKAYVFFQQPRPRSGSSPMH